MPESILLLVCFCSIVASAPVQNTTASSGSGSIGSANGSTNSSDAGNIHDWNCIQTPERQDQGNATSYDCLGHEPECEFEHSYSYRHVRCTERSGNDDLQTIDDQRRLFWRQADFGYVQAKVHSMGEHYQKQCASAARYLHCTIDMTYCYGRQVDVIWDVDNARRPVIVKGMRCPGDTRQTGGDRGAYMSGWVDDVQWTKRHNDTPCDVYLNETVMFVKFDPAVNLYHHFTNFINLYITQLLNEYATEHINVSMIVLWVRRPLPEGQTYPEPNYRYIWSLFAPKIVTSQYDFLYDQGNKVCIRRLILAHPPRTRRGIYFKMPLVYGCQGSGLFAKFRQFLISAFNINQEGPYNNRIRVTLLNRGEKKHRRIVNLNQLQAVLMALRGIQLRVEEFDNSTNFVNHQLRLVHNTDVLVAMHGAALTHMIWLPPWAAVVELYNCGDTACYYDLARLSGVNYRTFDRPNRSVIPQNTKERRLKFNDYWVDAEDFLGLVLEAIRCVVEHREFVRHAR